MKIRALILSFLFASSAMAVETADHHTLHNFSNNNCKHAYEMLYNSVANSYNSTCRDDSGDYSYMELICNANAKAAPIVIYKHTPTGDVYVRYQWWLEPTSGSNNTLATLLGLTRVNGTKYAITNDDLNAIKHYCAAKNGVDSLTTSSSYEDITSYLHTLWPFSQGDYVGTSVRANFQSKKVVNDIVSASTTYFNWANYDILFFDSCGDDFTTQAYNYDWGGDGNYASWATGQLDYLDRVSTYARDTGQTGKAEAVVIYANAYSLRRAWGGYNKIMSWYADDDWRADHYFYEVGGDGQIAANGSVPGSSPAEAAYVDPSNPTTSYIPADIVQLDDPYSSPGGWSAHLDACGEAGINGGWFGWYGEDYPDRGAYYTVDLILLRAIPNWDNLASVAIPEYDNPQGSDERTWDDTEYWSTQSGANEDVVYSTNPLNDEMYIVFKSTDGIAYIPDGYEVDSGYTTDKYFTVTATNIIPHLTIDGNEITLDNDSYLDTGIRLDLVTDTTVPGMDNGQPSTEQACTTNPRTDLTVSWDTDENANCRISTTDQSYDDMGAGKDATNGQGTTEHSEPLASEACGTTVDRYVQCADLADTPNKTSSALHIQFGIASESPPPEDITGSCVGGGGQASLN